MSTEDGFIAQVIGALSRALSPLVEATASPEALGALLARLGWTTAPNAAVVDAIAEVNEAIDRLADDVADEAGAPVLTADVIAAIGAIAALEHASAGATTAPFDDPAFWRALPEELIALLVSDDLRANAPGIYGLLSFTGVIRVEPRAADPATGRAAYDARVLDWSALGRAVSSPSTLFADVFGWGTHLDHSRFLAALSDLGVGLGGSASRLTPPQALADRYLAPDNPDRGKAQLLSVSPVVMDSPTLEGTIKVALLVLPLPPEGAPSDAPNGVLLRVVVSGTAQSTVDLGPAAQLHLDGDFQATPLRIQLRPGRTTVEDASPSKALSARVDITPPTPFVMAGVSGGTRVELTRAHLGLAVSDSDVTIDAALDEAVAVLSLAGADSFLRGVMGDGESSLPLTHRLSWSSSSGLRFSGSAQLSLTISTDLRILNVVTVTEIAIEIGPGDADGLRLTITVDGSFELGPLALFVENLGLELNLLPASLETPGNFGLLDLALGFKPPTGFGLSVDLDGIITGGGFLSIDGGRYAGVAALQVFGVGLTVVGIIETELPRQPNGWSLFLSVIADFTPVPLGFGFFLSGVGGFMGLHRTLDELALAEGVREGRIDSLLFPEDPLSQVTQILADIESYFPTHEGTHSFGVMARIDWGVPALISGELGVVLVVPDFRIAVIGEIESVLPSQDFPIIELHMGVVGYIDPAEATFWVAASIYDSRLVQYALSGDMAMYASLGDQPYFLLSVGGYHPDWKLPASVPASMRGLRRMTAAIDLGEALQIGLDAYFAITSNTLQFGAEVFAVARARELGVDFSASGSFGFDVLMIFTPFSLVTDMKAHISIKAEGVPLFSALVKLHVEGPEPWFGRATANFKFGGLPIHFHVAVGGSIDDEKPDSIELWDELERALQDAESWSTPATVSTTLPEISMRALDPVAEPGLWLEPDGALEMRQRVLPLNRAIEAYGAYVPSGESRFDIEAAGLTDGVEADWTGIDDWFAPAQFTAMTADERLAAPSFEEMRAGISLSASSVTAPGKSGDTATVDLEYEELVLEGVTRPRGRHPLAVNRFGLGPRCGVFNSKAPSSRRGVSNMTLFSVAPQRYGVVDPLDATPLGKGADRSFADALIARRSASTVPRARVVPIQSIREDAA